MTWNSLAEPASSTLHDIALCTRGWLRQTRLSQRVLKGNTSMERIGFPLLFLRHDGTVVSIKIDACFFVRSISRYYAAKTALTNPNDPT